MAEIKGCGEANMMRLWRAAVRKKNGNRCFLCGKSDQGQLQCHHIVHCRNMILRYDYRNGVPVCDHPCHSKIDSIAGRERLVDARPHDIIHITEFETMTLKDYLHMNGIYKSEFLNEKKKELQRILSYVPGEIM